LFGWLAKPNLTLPERSALMLTIVAASLMAYVRHHEWLNEEHRATVIDNWLKRNNRKSGLVFRARISQAADELARFLVAFHDADEIGELFAFLERAQNSRPGEFPDDDKAVHALMAECERALIANGLAA
jgi:hypothetical protein